MKNTYKDVVKDFGEEWDTFDHINIAENDQIKIFNDYFKIFPWDEIDKKKSIGIDIGCGSGRWSKFVADNTKDLILLDPSVQALDVAKKNLNKKKNIRFLNQSVGEISLEDNSIDFAYSLGVLHHIPDIKSALKEINRILKPNAPFLVYLYYSFDNKPKFYKFIWMLTNPIRYFISKLPFKIKFVITFLIAIFIYFPFARISKLLKFFKLPYQNIPMWQYADLSFYIMKTDALDRFGTKVEKRYSRRQIIEILEESNFKEIKFSDAPPYWCAVAKKK